MSFVRSRKVKRTSKLGPKQKAGNQARGFALIVVLLLMLLLSAVSIGLMFMATNEGKVGGGDVQNNLAFHAAEGALEKMTVDLATQMTNMQSPQLSDINLLGTKTKPADSGGVFYLTYQFTAQPDPANPTAPASSFGQITGGPNDGLYAQVIPVQLSAVVQTGMGAQVNMTRSVEIALIPAFQFGVFSQGDLGFYSSPNLTFNGRVHTNGDLYLGVSNGATVTFGDKLSAYGNVIRTILPNGLSSTNANYNNNGTVLIPTASTGCLKGAACRALLMNEGSIDPLVSLTAQNASPPFTVTAGLYNGYLTDGNNGLPGGTGAIQLTMPFTGSDPNNPTAQPAKPFEIIRRPPGPAIEDPTGPVAAARLANQAQIRVLLSDTPQENHLDGSAVDANDVQLVSQVPSQLTTLYTPPAGAATAQNGITVGGLVYYFGESKAGDTGLVKPAHYHGATFPGAASEWPLIDGFLRVEYKDTAGVWHPITNEWLNLGFARDNTVPKVPGGNLVHPQAILRFQQLADRNNIGNVSGVLPTGLNSQYNFYPINFYDAREGEMRDVVTSPASSDTTTAVNGVMNAVELDVGNLRRWFLDKTSSGANVDYVKENGYILYFSDRRGMLPNPNNGNLMQGEYGFEDVINSGSSAVAVDGVLEAPTAGCPPKDPNARPVSPEDVNGNCKLDNYGATNVGEAFGVNTNTNPPNPYLRVDALGVARKNRVTGARHVLKLIDGGLGNLPTRLDNSAGGFTVASENPVYIWGDYNTNASDTTWATVIPPAVPVEQPHSAAAVIADAVTLLSSSWSDPRSFTTPTSAASRPAAPSTSYRVAIAAGKNLTFPAPKWIINAQYGYGTDGGVHNFLRFLENWGGDTLNYKGSMVSLFYATYNTGTFKCCNLSVYEPPVRNFQFDELFITANGLPPGTPMFRDVNNLSYRQDFTPDAAPATKY